MKPLILFLTFVFSFALTSVVMASPMTEMFEGGPNEAPTKAEFNEYINDTVCKAVGINGIVAQRKKNDGVPLSTVIEQYDAAVARGGDNSEPAQVTQNISLGAINAVYTRDIPTTTQEELAQLGVTIYNLCRTVADQINWDLGSSTE